MLNLPTRMEAMERKSIKVIHDLDRDATMIVLPAGAYGSTRFAGYEGRGEEWLQLADGARTRRIILDLTQVRCFGAAFLGMLVRLARRLRGRNRKLLVCGDSQNLVRLARLDRVIPVYPTWQEALYGCGQRINDWNAPRVHARSTEFMPHIIAQTLAEQLANSKNETEARRVIDLALQNVASAGFAADLPEILSETSAQVQQLLLRSEGRRRRILAESLSLLERLAASPPQALAELPKPAL